MEPVDAERRQARRHGLRECLLMALMLYGVAPGDASAGDELSFDSRREADARKPAHHIAAPSFPAQFALFAPGAESQEFSPTEFRPRKPGLMQAAPGRSEASVIDAPILRDTSLAREFSEAKNQGRVRLLTLWQARASSLSLQAGKGGSPSLQWSTPWMHHDASSRGLFDRLLPVSQRSFGGAIRSGISRQAGAIGSAKPLESGAPVGTK